ncbi:hypothetical protein BGHDH14_bgh03626 [Blumeria hordei DH14]|uniref:Uncharacterized protein n=1 Tax=Blumeria graminis f. sp. hordei (strain DH14) TaxID=546991 RepID=N1JJ13_BLUG1|nr:hypothetical protein BGHDH14_bgh03626 [Blumeria hordei DH14]
MKFKSKSFGYELRVYGCQTVVDLIIVYSTCILTRFDDHMVQW